MTHPELYLGVDVGTGSVRAAVFDAAGQKAGQSVAEIRIWRPREDFAEQSSEDIWRAAGEAIRGALAEAGAPPESVRGVGFDATCSLVAVGARGEPVSVSPTHADEQNVILWMDHRAVEQASRINTTGHEVLKYVGGLISPEMEMPKLLWLKENHAECWRRAKDFFDLPDYLTFRATGSRTRSLCTTVCKWTYLGHDGGRWADDFLRQIGLEELAHADHARIGETVRPLGESVGVTTEHAARELGLAPGTPVGVSIIDAHAGGLGLLGTALGTEPLDAHALERRLALIGGTSSCHMAVSRDARFVPGVWGPYYSAMVPRLWLTEGGQSATGALIDHVIHTHVRGPALAEDAKRQGTTVYALLNEELERLGGAELHALSAELHVMPDFHGNRSPRADPTLRGMASGLKLTDSVSSLALLYLATVQAVAYGTRHILEALAHGGYRIDTVLACGGDTKNPLFVREHADITGCRIVLPREPEAVLLGSALLGAVAAGRHATILDAMSAMSGARDIVAPRAHTAAYHARKYAVFHRMHADQLAYRALMAGG
ncbi:MAG TPA: FGGY-family carbohydrate kinase [Polyangiaceae bacterium]|nr:FGGY-family carbohydrate kinase [Polyangiaceae bacterium]